MSIVEKVKTFIESYPKIADFIHIDYQTDDAGSYGLMPSGQTVIEREYDVLGNLIIHKQYNLVLYATDMTYSDVVRLENINFLDDFTEWIELTDKPVLGDLVDDEIWDVQNGMLFELNPDKNTGTYQIQINIKYKIWKEAI